MTVTTSITVRVRLTIRRRSGRKTVVTPVQTGSEAALPTRSDPALVKALARAFRHQKLLDDGRYASISEMAEAEKIERGYLGSLLRRPVDDRGRVQHGQGERRVGPASRSARCQPIDPHGERVPGLGTLDEERTGHRVRSAGDGHLPRIEAGRIDRVGDHRVTIRDAQAGFGDADRVEVSCGVEAVLGHGAPRDISLAWADRSAPRLLQAR